MAEDTVDQAIEVANLDHTPCNTINLQIHGYHRHADKFGILKSYGSDAPQLETIINEQPDYKNPLHPRLRPLSGEVIWAVRHEMARNVEDFLARRTRSLTLDARASVEMAEKTAELMAKELHKNKSWINGEVNDYKELAGRYTI